MKKDISRKILAWTSRKWLLIVFVEWFIYNLVNRYFYLMERGRININIGSSIIIILILTMATLAAGYAHLNISQKVKLNGLEVEISSGKKRKTKKPILSSLNARKVKQNDKERTGNTEEIK
ncbi:MAG: hypothetical protein ACTSWR_06030 [Candidatus Helarchaeota archaeon]